MQIETHALFAALTGMGVQVSFGTSVVLTPCATPTSPPSKPAVSPHCPDSPSPLRLRPQRNEFPDQHLRDQTRQARRPHRRLRHEGQSTP
ncbi:hypothetical protein ACQ4WX_40770 [Streptomyces lasalocidi]